MDGPEPISPELALVSPELAAEARRALPDRPWERFAPPRPAAPAPLPAAAAVPVERPVLRTAPLPASLPVPPAVDRRRRRIVTPSRVVTAAVVALLLVTSFLPPRDAPRLVAGDPFPVLPPAAATPPSFSVQASGGDGCVSAGGQRDPFRPVCPPGRAP